MTLWLNCVFCFVCGQYVLFPQLFAVDTRLADYSKSGFDQIKLNWTTTMTTTFNSAKRGRCEAFYSFILLIEWTCLNYKTINTKFTIARLYGTDTGETPQAEGDSRPGLWKLLIVSGTRTSGHQRLKLETVGFKGKASIRKSSYCL